MKFLPSLRTFVRLLAVIALGSLCLVPAAMAGSNYENYTFVTLAGQTSGWFDGTGSDARFYCPFGTAVDSQGNCYVADSLNHTIRKITPEGVVMTLAGQAGMPGSSDGAGSAAHFNSPRNIAVDANGNLYVADAYNHTIRKITPAGVVTTLAGSAGNSGSTNGTGSSARFNMPFGVAVDNGGNVYAADTFNDTIRKITPAGVVTTLAGQAGASGSTNGTGSAARFYYPCGLVVDANTNIFVADTYNYTIRKITPAGVVTTLAGQAGSKGTTDGTNSTARFSVAMSIALSRDGNLYAVDSGSAVLRKVTQDGVVTTLAGSPNALGSVDGTNSVARFNSPCGVAADQNGNLYIGDWANSTIRKVTPAGAVTTLAGVSAAPGISDGVASDARFSSPFCVLPDANGNLYVSDLGNHTIRKIDSNGIVTTLAGSPRVAGTNDGVGSAARFNNPGSLTLDKGGNLYVADFGNHTIRKITPSGQVSTLAGTAGQSGTNDGPAAAAQFWHPLGIAMDNSTNLYVADTWNNTIRKMTPDGQVSTLAGLAQQSGTNDGPGSAARFNYPKGIALDANGTIYVADSGNATIRKITPAGVVSTLAGAPQVTGADDGAGAAARFNSPSYVAIDSQGNLFVGDSSNHLIRKVTPAGVVTTLGGVPGETGGADGTGANALFNFPEGVAVDGNGNLYVANASTHTIRKGSPALSDTAVVDLALGPVGPVRHFDVTNATTTTWSWRIVRYPATSSAQLSSSSGRNPTLTPDVPDLFVVRFEGRDNAGRIALSMLSLGADSAPPAVAISQPAFGQQFTNESKITVTGTASDDVGIATVWYRFNSGAWALATGKESWSVPVTLVPGSNTFSVYAIDMSGKTSTTNSVRFRYAPVLRLSVPGYGTRGIVSPTFYGQTMQIGKQYTITATALKGYLFAGWTDYRTGEVLATTPKLTFTMSDGLVLQANFITNFFIGLKGNYAGLFAADTNAVALTNAGGFTASLTDLGRLTGKVLLGGASYSLSGSFSAAGAYSNSVAGPGKIPLTVQLQLDLNGGQKITGTVSNIYWSADLLANRAIYGLTNPAPQGGKKYTLVIPGTTNSVAGPGGNGYGTLSVDASGNFKFSGTLGDGTKVSQSSFVSRQGQWPLYLSANTGKEMVWGWLNFVTNMADRDITGQVQWLKQAGAPGKFYPAGFNFGNQLTVAGSIYARSYGVPVFGWINGVMVLEGGNLSADLDNSLVLGPAEKASGPNKLGLTITTASGLFQGSVLNPETGKPIAVNGVLLQKQNAGYGLFLGTNQTGSVYIRQQ